MHQKSMWWKRTTCFYVKEKKREQSISVSERSRLTINHQGHSSFSLLLPLPNLTLNLSDLGLWRTNELAPTRPFSSGDSELVALAAEATGAPLLVSAVEATPIFLFQVIFLALDSFSSGCFGYGQRRGSAISACEKEKEKKTTTRLFFFQTGFFRRKKSRRKRYF